MNYLITGASGFVGSYLAKDLIQDDHEVYGLMRKRSDFAIPENLKDREIVDEINMIEGDLREISSLGQALTESDPDVVFHLGAQSYVPRSFDYPLETLKTNTMGTANLLEAMRQNGTNARFVFAGSSEEYGFVGIDSAQVQRGIEKYGEMNPPCDPPEVPISENNPLRPMSPYGVSKVHGEHLTRNYHNTYGMDTVVSRAFNHEGAGRGDKFVTSVLTKQAAQLRANKEAVINIGNVNAFRDWTHVKDVVKGYRILADHADSGAVYNQGSGHMHSVLTFMLLSIREAVGPVSSVEIGDATIENPVENEQMVSAFGEMFGGWKTDQWLLEDNRVELKDGPLVIHSEGNDFPVQFKKERFRPSDVPYLWADNDKIKSLGWNPEHTLVDIINDQLNYYLDASKRQN